MLSLSVPAHTSYKSTLICSTGVRDLALLFQFASDSLNQVDTLNGVMIILFDTVVVAVTTFHTLAILRLQKGINVLNNQSLSGVLIQQGMHISLVVGELLTAKKVWSDMGNSHFLPSFLRLSIV